MEVKYKIICDDMAQNIHNGMYLGSKKLPTEEELIEKYQVSRNTIRKAIDLLTRKGLVIPIQGSGVFIRNVACNGAINLEDFNGLTEGFGNKVTTKVISFKLIEADEKLAHTMQCEVGTPIYFIERLRSVSNTPYVIEYSYYNKDVIPYLSEEIVSGSIYKYIRDELKKQIGFVDREITAGILSEHDARELGLTPGEPALISTNRAYLKNGVIFDYSIDIHNYKETRFLKLSNYM
ncbi:GntR family transcriptional regulator [Proteiniclasticum sp. SCR006]|uniref:GntR family transcriptional regulator n=1 Tax=Proteiniclasticum aestuarii TaxID=2817862 RepID=A0A939HBI3_9CLOT|nr:GntR family transcriptional regulator [Proteiniclasticum aestuarii]MBO1264560.1 GntR family transcriptional regulator [Proteiniclasticum aestuarii]